MEYEDGPAKPKKEKKRRYCDIWDVNHTHSDACYERPAPSPEPWFPEDSPVRPGVSVPGVNADADCKVARVERRESSDPRAVGGYEQLSDSVVHPSHYTFGKYEVIDVIKDWGLNFNCGTLSSISHAPGRKTLLNTSKI
jgi:hypothetical protein